MRKLITFILFALITTFMTGCGGTTNPSTVAWTNQVFTSADNVGIGKTYYLASTSTSTAVPFIFTDATNVTVNGSAGTWSYANGLITVTVSSTTYNFQRIQTESNYWLVYDSNDLIYPYRYYRFYFDQANGSTQANAYLASIKVGSQVLMGGTVQGGAVPATTTVSTIAGSPVNNTYGYDDGTGGTTAKFNQPVGITTDGLNLYVTDSANHAIRRIVISTGAVSTLAGTGSAGSADGKGTAASFNNPTGITCDGTSLYVTDTNNQTIRKIDLTSANYGQVTTIGGTALTAGAQDASVGTTALFNTPQGITTDGTNLYITDTGNNAIRKMVISSTATYTFAGTMLRAGMVDANGIDARFYTPGRIVTDGSYLYLTDAGNRKIRKICIATQYAGTLAGDGTYGSTDNITGTSAKFAFPNGITMDGTNLYVTDYGYYNYFDAQNNLIGYAYMNVIRQIVISTGVVTTIAGGSSQNQAPVDGLALSTARFSKPLGITSDGSSLYITNFVNASPDVYSNIRKLGN